MKKLILLIQVCVLLFSVNKSLGEQGRYSFDGERDPVLNFISDRHPPSIKDWYNWPEVKSMSHDELFRRFVYWIEQPDNPKGKKNGVLAAFSAMSAQQLFKDDPYLNAIILQVLRDADSHYQSAGVLRHKIASNSVRHSQDKEFLGSLSEIIKADSRVSNVIRESINKKINGIQDQGLVKSSRGSKKTENVAASESIKEKYGLWIWCLSLVCIIGGGLLLLRKGGSKSHKVMGAILIILGVGFIVKHKSGYLGGATQEEYTVDDIPEREPDFPLGYVPTVHTSGLEIENPGHHHGPHQHHEKNAVDDAWRKKMLNYMEAMSARGEATSVEKIAEAKRDNPLITP